MKALLLLVMLTACAASPQDLTGKMFTFPEETNTANVKMNLPTQNLNAASVCFRFITDLRRRHSLFSLSTNQFSNHFLILKDEPANSLDIYINNKSVRFEGLNYELNTWHSVCSSWDAESGLGQLWFDGKPTVRRFFGESQISQPIVVLGQEQDSFGGRFDAKQSFVGMMSDIHMWDYTLSACEIQRYMDDKYFTPGNVLNWRALTFQATGRVLIETKDMTCS
ncbi:serum amyloid P-component-like [Kryptolebias marmoratus]|uniref:Pentraxin family member n=1 Tax=Kryptolebias marmoratus TaxID=37003 RepID=A0A3Q3B179_KRYMA|nr:serum amyloid P-component-like [Kryptolebias marmoratus]